MQFQGAEVKWRGRAGRVEAERGLERVAEMVEMGGDVSKVFVPVIEIVYTFPARSSRNY